MQGSTGSRTQLRQPWALRLQHAWAGVAVAPAASAWSGSSSTVPGVAATRRNNFDGLRLLAALLVVYGHQTADLSGTFGLRLVLFFSISGFLVAGSWYADPHVVRFLIRRFLRIWPAYAVVIVACAAVSYVFPSPDMPEISRLASTFYLGNLWFSGFEWGFFPAHNPFMNQSLWMMRYEVDIYLAFALVAVFGRRLVPLAAGAMLVLSLRAAETHPAPGGLLECWSLYFGGFFSFGILLREFPRLRSSTVVACCVAAGIALLWLGERTAGLLTIVPPAAVWVGERSFWLLRSAARFGDLSFGIFLWAWPVQQVTRLWLDPRVPMPLQFAIVLVQIATLAWLSWRFIEAPALRRKPAKPSAPRRTDFDDLVSA